MSDMLAHVRMLYALHAYIAIPASDQLLVLRTPKHLLLISYTRIGHSL